MKSKNKRVLWRINKYHRSQTGSVRDREAETLGLTVSILNGNKLKEVENALDGKKFKGTVIK